MASEADQSAARTERCVQDSRADVAPRGLSASEVPDLRFQQAAQLVLRRIIIINGRPKRPTNQEAPETHPDLLTQHHPVHIGAILPRKLQE